MVRIEGRWDGRKRPHVDEAMLVVENEGRRHRFPAIPQEGKPRRLRRHESWSGSFDLPSWLGDHLEGQTSLRLGDATIALPAGAFARPEGGETAALRAEMARLRHELAVREAAQQAALSEAASLRTELERLADELAGVRANALAQGGLDQAEDLLVQARELRRLLAESGPESVAEHPAADERPPGEHSPDTASGPHPNIPPVMAAPGGRQALSSDPRAALLPRGRPARHPASPNGGPPPSRPAGSCVRA